MTDNIWMQLLGVVAGVMMLFVLWPAYKHWSKNSPKAQSGDWGKALIPIVAVLLFVALLMMSV